MKYFNIILFFNFQLSFFFGFSQIPNENPFKLFLVGDAGEKDTTGQILLDLKTKLENNPNSAVIFLGDNCYKKTFFGLIKLELKGFDGSKITRKRIMAQLNILRNYKGSAYFVPGNHDWWNSLSIKKGKKHLLKEELFIEDSLKNFNTLLNHNEETFLPANGNPGPISKQLNNGRLTIIFLDTYRILLEEMKKGPKHKLALNEFYKKLQEQITEAKIKNQKIIVAAHHPIYSKGNHSHPYKPGANLFKRAAISNLNSTPYKKIANKIDSLLKIIKVADIFYVAGHEHSLEYFLKDNIHYIVSGAGSKVDKVNAEATQNNNEYLIWNEEGFFEIDFANPKPSIIIYHRKNNQSVLQDRCVDGCNN